MLLLSAVNEILPKLGERPVTSTLARNPTLSIIIPEIDAQRRNLLTKGWWFNRFYTTLYPDINNEIPLPVGTYSFVSKTHTAVQRGLALYNGDTLSFTWDESVSGTIIQDVDFELLPECAAQVVLYNAMVACYGADIGMEAVVQLWAKAGQDANRTLERDHLRYSQYDTKRSKRYSRYHNSLRG